MSTLWLDAAVNPRLCERPQEERGSILEQLPEISDCRLVTDGDVALALAAIPSPPLCERTPQVRDAILNMIPGVSDCADVTDVHLDAITGTLSFSQTKEYRRCELATSTDSAAWMRWIWGTTR